MLSSTVDTNWLRLYTTREQNSSKWKFFHFWRFSVIIMMSFVSDSQNHFLGMSLGWRMEGRGRGDEERGSFLLSFVDWMGHKINLFSYFINIFSLWINCNVFDERRWWRKLVLITLEKWFFNGLESVIDCDWVEFFVFDWLVLNSQLTTFSLKYFKSL